MSSHAVIRARERYGVDISLGDMRKIKTLISFPNPCTIHLEGDLFAFRFHHRWIALVYTDKEIVTALPEKKLYPRWRKTLKSAKDKLRELGIEQKSSLRQKQIRRMRALTIMKEYEND